MDLNHLHLLVKDLEISKSFYIDLFGFKEKTSYGPNLLFLQNSSGFDLALTPQEEISSLPKGIHFGFSLSNQEELITFYQKGKELYSHLFAQEPKDHEGWGSFTCHDPNGYIIELYWDSTLH